MMRPERRRENRLEIKIMDEDITFEDVQQTIPQNILHLQAQDTRDEVFSKFYCKVLFVANRMLREQKQEIERIKRLSSEICRVACHHE